MTVIFLNLLILGLWSNIKFILANVLCILEKNVDTTVDIM